MKKERCLCWVALLQAVGITVYCGLVGMLMWGGNKWFGPMNNFMGPLLFLLLFVVSALICGLIGVGYSGWLFFEKKERNKALRLVGYTAGWLVLFTVAVIAVLAWR